MSNDQQKALTVLAAIRAGYLSHFFGMALLHSTCCRLLDNYPIIDTFGLDSLYKNYNELGARTFGETGKAMLAKCRDEIIKEYGLESRA